MVHIFWAIVSLNERVKINSYNNGLTFNIFMIILLKKHITNLLITIHPFSTRIKSGFFLIIIVLIFFYKSLLAFNE